MIRARGAPTRKVRARLAILNHISTFSLARMYGDYVHRPIDDMVFRENRAPAPGALVALHSAPPSKWYLSWVVGTKRLDGGMEYTLESIEDGALCRWGNVSLVEYSPQTVASHPEWHWTDAQFAFNDRWHKVCRQHPGGYMSRPIPASFEGGFAVTLGRRTSHGFDDIVVRRTFPDWRKVTIAAMRAWFTEAIAIAHAIHEGYL